MTETLLPLAELYSPIRDDLLIVERVFDAELKSDLDFLNDMCSSVRSYRGKMLRPALLLLAGRATGQLSSDHHTLAAVVEMVHMATLVHDDVLDEAHERRGERTIVSRSGNRAAVLLGDYLISHAFHLCSSLDSQYASRRIGATTNTVCEGELLQNRFAGNDELSEDAYFDILRRKTGALTAVACELGAKCAGAEPVVVKAMYAYGMSAGVAFQIVDDVLDVIGDEECVGKTLGRDLTLGKLTLPTLHCLRASGPETAAKLRDAIRGSRDVDAATVRTWLEESGSVEHAVSTARAYVLDATKQLERLAPSEATQSLVAVAEFIVARRF